ncbi:DNA-binding protein H-NS, partial [Escherichia coli 95.0183]
GGIFYCPV